MNLFDIVRLYEGRDSKNNKPGKTTISEAQLIGRGARYYPFVIDDAQDKFKRKYDKALDNELRILEELHYHSHNESRYISEIKTALIEEGLMDEREVEVELKLKDKFKNTSFYKTGLVYANKKKARSYDNVKKLEDLGVSRKNIVFSILSGLGRKTSVFDDKKDKKDKDKDKKDISLQEIEKHIIKNALVCNDFYNFSNLSKYFLRVKSINEFIEKQLSNLSITFEGEKSDLENLNNENKFKGVLKLLDQIEGEIKNNSTEYVGTEEFIPLLIKDKFKNKRIKIQKESDKLEGQKEFLEDRDWYVFNANYGTKQEKDFVELIARQVDDFKKDFKNIYLIRNERELKIYNLKDGRAFEPDYLLFLINKKNNKITYQLFLEPKGPQLAGSEKWKNDFLEQIRDKYKNKILEFNKTKKYKIIGVPFYINEQENEFKEKLINSIN